MDDAQRRRRTWLICVGLALAILGAYGQIWRNDFINFDDPDYVTGNQHVFSGLTWPNFVWAFTTVHAGNWHPLTWLSLMVDCQLFDLHPAGHHLMNVALHLASSLLLFLLLQRMTGAAWPSAAVAALFGLHPMHVESVAWVAERKDVLSGLFWMLAIWAYVRHVQNSKFYWLSVVWFALGLMAKPMLVTLPLVLLLLDYWPLQRREKTPFALVAEKIPYLVLAAASGVITFLAQARGGAVMPMANLKLAPRLANVLASYLRYAVKLFWPAHHAVFYPILRVPAWETILAGALLLLLTAVAFGRARPQPWLAVGWFWFLGTLAPVVGILQVGLQSMAERYTYLPSIGLFIAVVWTVRNWEPRLLAVLGALAVAACLVLTMRQTARWRNSEILFTQAIENTTSNFYAYDILGTCLEKRGLTNAAIADYKTSLSIKPLFADPHDNLGRIYLAEGRTDEALAELKEAVDDDPKLASARYNLGYALLAEGKVGEALDQFQAQVNLQPDEFRAQNNMGAVLLQNGLAADARPFLLKAIELEPDNSDAHYHLGNALFRMGHDAEAIRQYEKVLQISPDDVQARNDLAWILACDPNPSVRNGARAVDLASRADIISRGQNPVVIGTLAAAYAETGKFSDAITINQRAREMARTQTNNALAELLEKRLSAYEAKSPWRDTSTRK